MLVHWLNSSFIHTGIIKARVFPDPVFAAPRTSLSQSECGSDALCMSLIVTNLFCFNPSLVFCDNGNWSNRLHPAYRENPPSANLPTKVPGGRGGKERGLVPESGFPESIHSSRVAISSDSERRICFQMLGFFLDLCLGFAIRKVKAGNLRWSEKMIVQFITAVKTYISEK